MVILRYYIVTKDDGNVLYYFYLNYFIQIKNHNVPKLIAKLILGSVATK